jgi:hypothetical protein
MCRDVRAMCRLLQWVTMNGHPVITVAPLPGGLAVWASAMH